MRDKLDIIIPHGGEPWRICRGFFDMMRLQLGTGFEGVRILIVHDGCGKFPEHQVAIPGVRVDQIEMPKAGVSAARNVGMARGKAEWVMFCDIDDRFAGVWAMMGILEALELEAAKRMDMLWMPFYIEQARGRKVEEFNLVFIHGKIYRRKFLEDNGLKFFPELYYAEDSAFNACVGEKLEEGRYGRINTDAVPYVWVFNRESVTSRAENKLRNLDGLFDRHEKITRWMKMNGQEGRWRLTAARVIRDAFYQWDRDDLERAALQALRERMAAYIRKYARDAETITEEEKEIIWEAATREAELKRLPKKPRDGFRAWLKDVTAQNARGT